MHLPPLCYPDSSWCIRIHSQRLVELQHKSLNFFDGCWVDVNLHNYLCITINKLVLYLLKLADAKAASNCVVTIMVADAPIIILLPLSCYNFTTYSQIHISQISLFCTHLGANVACVSINISFTCTVHAMYILGFTLTQHRLKTFFV